jgi:hypothetical protein
MNRSLPKNGRGTLFKAQALLAGSSGSTAVGDSILCIHKYMYNIFSFQPLCYWEEAPTTLSEVTKRERERERETEREYGIYIYIHNERESTDAPVDVSACQ